VHDAPVTVLGLPVIRDSNPHVAPHASIAVLAGR